jgi:hypothetical protein
MHLETLKNALTTRQLVSHYDWRPTADSCNRSETDTWQSLDHWNWCIKWSAPPRATQVSQKVWVGNFKNFPAQNIFWNSSFPASAESKLIFWTKPREPSIPWNLGRPRKFDPFFRNIGISLLLQTRKLGGNCWVMDQLQTGPIVHWPKSKPKQVRAREHLKAQDSENRSQI